MNSNQDREVRDRKIDRINSNLNALAQCAVGILSLMGMMNITLLAFSTQLSNSFLVLIGVIVIIVAIVLHYIILLWGLPQLIEFAILDKNENENIGLRCLLCSIYFIEDWKHIKKKIKKCVKNHSNIKEMFKHAKKKVNVPRFPKRFGILALLYIALAAESIFFIIAYFILKFPLFEVAVY